MPLIRYSGESEGVASNGDITCFTVVEGANQWSPENHTYLPIKFVRRKLAEYRRRRIEAVDAIVFLLFFIFYVCVLQFEYFSRIEHFYWASEAVVATLERRRFRPFTAFSRLRSGEVDLYHAGRGFENMFSPQDWHHWLRDVVVDSLFNASLFPAEATDIAEKVNTINYFREGGQLVKVGALRVRALRVREQCKGVGKGCAYFYSRDALDRSPFGPLTFGECAPWVVIEGLARYDYTCRGLVLDIPFSSGHEAAVRAVKSLRVDSTTDAAASSAAAFTDVVDLQTVRALSVEFVLYLPTADAYLFASCLTEIPLGGGFVSRVNTVVFGRDITLLTLVFIGLSAVLLCVLFFLVAYRQAEYLWRTPTGFERWWVVLGRFGLWVLHLLLLSGHLACLCFRIVMTPAIPIDGTSEVFSPGMWEAYMLYRVEVYLASFAVLFSIGRLLTVFQFLPLMKTVAITFVVAFKNMLGVGLAFVFLIVGYAISGYFLFCDAVEGFRDPWASAQTVVLALLGAFDYEDLRLSIPGASPVIYYWSFIIVTISICFNFLVGILGGALEKVTNSEGELEGGSNLSFWGVLWGSFRQLRWEISCVLLQAEALDSLQETLEQVWLAEVTRIAGDAFGDFSLEKTAALHDEKLVVAVTKEQSVDFFLRYTLIRLDLSGLPRQWAKKTAATAMGETVEFVPCYNISDVDLLILHGRRCQRYAEESLVDLSFLHRFRRWMTKPVPVDSTVSSSLWFAGDKRAKTLSEFTLRSSDDRPERQIARGGAVGKATGAEKSAQGHRDRGGYGEGGANLQPSSKGLGLSHQFADTTIVENNDAEELSAKVDRALENSYAELLRELDDMSLKLAIVREWYARKEKRNAGR